MLEPPDRGAIMQDGISVFEDHESQVRIYCRQWPTVFSTARGSRIRDEYGMEYIDFFAGAGSLNYGHNNPHLKQALLRYLQEDAIVQSLDMHTTSKRDFLQAFHQKILAPRGLDMRVQFSGPSGTTAVEAAIKLARKYTGRRSILSFENCFHGMSLGAMVLNPRAAGEMAQLCPHTIVAPYDDKSAAVSHCLASVEGLLSGPDDELPAACILETVQGEGGLYAARDAWLKGLADLCQSRGVLLIVDDIQVGCGRTGTFFSFEQSGILPDMVCLSKSISGYGLPLALTLLRPDLDIWNPGEHTGTFRGSNPSFVTGTAALDFWQDPAFLDGMSAAGMRLEQESRALAAEYPDVISGVRGRGVVWGLECRETGTARSICELAFANKLLVERSGRENDVVKLMPPLNISEADMALGLDTLRKSVKEAAQRANRATGATVPTAG
jgi:diaminobutyrate-2-oxoglutarate transaminase